MRSPRGRVALGPAVVLAAAAAVLGGCASGPSPDAATTQRPPSLAPPGSLGPPASARPAATPLVRIDPALLKVLPESVAGQSVLESSEADADASSNTSLAQIADSAVGALAIDPGSGDFVLPIVVRLKEGATFDDAGFRNWRDNFDVGVCGGGGISGHAQSQIGGRSVFVATCGNGLHTYHTWIAASRLLISASAGGSQDFGELLFGSLRP